MTDRFQGPGYRGYNDPAIANGFDALGKAFAPPSLADIYAGAKAKEAQQKMQGIAAMYDLAKSGDMSDLGKTQFDRYNAATGSGNMSTGYYGVDQKNITDKRGQDVTAATSVYNNNSDNKTKTDIAMLAPVGEGATRFVPPDLAGMYKTGPTQSGVINVKPGEQSTLPDGRVISGTPKPLTESEVKGGIIAGMTPEEKRAIGFGTTPVEIARNPTNNNENGLPSEPQPMTRPQMLANGAVPIDRTHAAQIFNYKTPDGKTGSAVYDPTSGGFVDSQTKQALPPGLTLQHPSGVQNQNGLGPTTANSTEANRKAAQLDEFERSLNGYEDLVRKNPGVVGLPGAVRGAAQNAVSVAQEFAGAFGNLDPNVKLGADQVQQIAAKVTAGRDPAIQRARVMEADLAYKVAQLQNPTGEVSRQAFERALETVAGGTLRNNDTALESAAQLREMIKNARAGVNSLRGPTNTPTPEPGPTPTPGGAATGPRVINTPAGSVTIQKVQ